MRAILIALVAFSFSAQADKPSKQQKAPDTKEQKARLIGGDYGREVLRKSEKAAPEPVKTPEKSVPPETDFRTR